MSITVDRAELLPAPPDLSVAAGGAEPEGFVDCRGLVHRWDEEED